MRTPGDRVDRGSSDIIAGVTIDPAFNEFPIDFRLIDRRGRSCLPACRPSFVIPARSPRPRILPIKKTSQEEDAAFADDPRITQKNVASAVRARAKERRTSLARSRFTLEATRKTAVPINNGSGEQKFRSSGAARCNTARRGLTRACRFPPCARNAQGFPLIGPAGARAQEFAYDDWRRNAANTANSRTVPRVSPPSRPRPRRRPGLWHLPGGGGTQSSYEAGARASRITGIRRGIPGFPPGTASRSRGTWREMRR